MSNSKKQADDLSSNLNNLPWGLPLAFPSMPSFGSFPPLGLPTSNFPMLNSFNPLGLSSAISNDSNNGTSAVSSWPTGLNNFDYNEYTKQLALLMNVFHEQKTPPIDQSNGKTSCSSSSKSKRANNPENHSSSSLPGKSSSSSNSNKTSTSRSKQSKTSTNSDSNTLSFPSATSVSNSNPAFPFFLPPLLSQTSSTTTGTNNNLSSMTYPFSNLSSSLLNPAASLYPFLSPDWFSSSKLIDTFTGLSSQNSHDSSQTSSQQTTSHSKRVASESPKPKHFSSSDSSAISKSKKRAKSIRMLTEEQNQNSATTETNRTSTQSADESRSNDDDDADPNPKRKKFEEVNETLVRLPLSIGWKRITIVRAITRTGVRGDVSYLAPCGRKLRSFQEIDRYLMKKKLTNLDRSNFTFSSKVHIGHFHEPKETADGKTIFQEFTDEQIIRRILEINPKFRPIRSDHEIESTTKASALSSPSATPNHLNGFHFKDETRTTHFNHEDGKKKNETVAAPFRRTSRENLQNSFTHNSFLQAIIEQQKQDFEHQQKLHQEQQEQERKRQELLYLKQLELKKRQEEKLLLIEQRKAEKNALREKKIQEKYMEIVLAKEKKRIVEDMQIRDLKDLPTLNRIENSRLSNEAFANALMIIEFVNNFKEILHLADGLIPTLNSFQQWTARDNNSLCQILLRHALEDPGIPNPKKNLTSLGQKLSEVDVTEHTFSEILRLYIRERNGFDEKISQTLSDSSFQSLSIDEKIEILAFLCHDLSTSKKIVEETDRHLEELITLKHEKLEVDKRLRRLKFDKANQNNGNNVKKLAILIREKDLNSSENESPDESDSESMKFDSLVISSNHDEEELQSIDESKIEDLDKRLELMTKKYNFIKRRVIAKQCRTRALHLGQDRYRRRYWFFLNLPGIYVEGLRTGDIPSDEIKEMIDSATKQRSEKKADGTNVENPTISRSTARKRPQSKAHNSTIPVTGPTVITEPNKIDNEEEITVGPMVSEELTPSCSIDSQTKDEENLLTVKIEPIVSMENVPLDLSCSKMKENHRSNVPFSKPDNVPFNEIKQENIIARNILDLTDPPTVKQETSTYHLKQIEQTIREKFQYPQPLPIPEDFQSGWWIIQTGDEIRSLIKCLARRGQRERFLCRMLQRYFDVIQNSIHNRSISVSSTVEQDLDQDHDDHQASSSNDFLEQQSSPYDATHEMNVLNEIYNLSNRIVTASLFCTSYETNISLSRLTYADIQSKGLDILDEAKRLLTDIERNIERRYLNPPFVRKNESNFSMTARSENSSIDEISSSILDEVPQQLERWRRAVTESRTAAQLALCLTQLERCIAWERSIMKVYCEICNCDDNEEKLLLCDGCDHGTHTYCFRPPMSSIPPNDWYCYVCIGKSKGENLCFVCGNNVDCSFLRCDQCGKLFHDYCLKNAKQQRGKWFCVLCSSTHDLTSTNNSTPTANNSSSKPSSGRQTLRSANVRQSSLNSSNTTTSTDGESTNFNSRSRSTTQRKSKSSNPDESSIPETESNGSCLTENHPSINGKHVSEEINSKKKITRSSKASKDSKMSRS